MKAAVIVLIVVVAVLAGGVAFLSTWNIPPPSKQVEKVIPNEKLSR
jgi:flagellar basal body-associated protein FliL